MSITREIVLKYTSLICLVTASLLLIPLQQHDAGWIIFLIGLVSLIGTQRDFAKHIVLLYFSITLLATTNIDTDISLAHMLQMGTAIFAAVIVPYLIIRFVYKEKIIEYPIGKHTWTKGHVGYLLLAAVLSYLILPIWMQTTGGYQNWEVIIDPQHLGLLFLGTNGLGIWDELFFIVTMLAIIKKHVPFVVANLLQAVVFTGFLYELGFTGWAMFAIYPFALLQGIVFKRTQNLTYIIAIHLTIDFILYLALINAHHPDILNIFITNIFFK